MSNKANEPSEIMNTPIGELIAMGLSNQKISEITGVGITGVSKWKTGRNKATAYAQNRAKGYIEGLNMNSKPVVAEISKDNHMFLVSVPYLQIKRFTQVMNMLNLEAVDMDQS